MRRRLPLIENVALQLGLTVLFAAAAVRRAALGGDGEAPPEPALRRRMLALAEELLTASPLRLRGIPADRILEGLVCRHFAG